MGKRILILMLMLGVVGSLSAVPWDNQENSVILSPSPGPLNVWGLDTPQPDTILYDNPAAPTVVLYGPTFHASVRFTPLAEFDLRAAYVGFRTTNLDTITDMFVTGDLNGNADPNNILTQTTFIPVTGWSQVDFPDTITFAANEDFHIVYGTVHAAIDPDVGPGTYAWLDYDVNNLLRSYYATGWPVPTWSYLYGYDWRCRAGGEYASAEWIDLAVINVDNQEMKYFLCQDDMVTFRALVENVGTLSAPSYSVTWTVRDEASAVVYTGTTAGGTIAVGVVDTVVAPTAWTASTTGEFICTAVVTAAGDVTPDNDADQLEQQVDDPTLSHLLDYDVSNFQVPISVNVGGGRSMEYTACTYPIEIIHLEVDAPAAGNAIIKVLGDDGTDAPDPSVVLFDSTIALAIGNNIIPTSIQVVSGPFHICYQYADATTPSLNNDAVPNAAENLTMPIQHSTSNSGASWELDSGSDHPLRAMINPFGGTIRDITVDWMTFPGFFGPGSDPFDGQIQVKNNGTNADTFDVSLTIEDTTFARSVVFSETQTVTDLAVGDSALLTYSTYNFPNIGEYILTAEAIVPGDANPGDNVLMAEHQTCLYPSELTYDDGTFENGWAFYDPGNFWGAIFEPPFYPCKITDMRLNFSTVPVGYDNAKAQIIASDQTTLLYDYEDPAVVVGWNSYSPGDVLIMSDYFYAGTEWVTGAPNAPYFSTDDTEPISYMTRQRIAGVWYYDVEEAGVRVTVDYAVMSPIVIERTGGSRNLDMQLTWTHAAAAGIWYFIYESSDPFGTYSLVDSVAYPAQSWSATSLPELKKFYYVTFGDASGARDQTLPGQYLWQPFEMTVSGNSAIEPGVIRAPEGVADHR